MGYFAAFDQMGIQMVSNPTQIDQIILCFDYLGLGNIYVDDEPDRYADGGVGVELGGNILQGTQLLARVFFDCPDGGEFDCKTAPQQIGREIGMM